MHELSIAQSIIDAATAEARSRGATCIHRIACRIGALRQIDAGLMHDAFGLAREGTLAASATLDIEPVGMRLACRSCGKATELSFYEFECPHCQSGDITLEGGDELELTSMEIDLPDEVDSTNAPAS